MNGRAHEASRLGDGRLIRTTSISDRIVYGRDRWPAAVVIQSKQVSFREGVNMTTAQHPSHMDVRWHPNHEWLWIAVSAMLVAFVTIAIVWVATRPEATVAPVLESATGFAYENEATAIQIAGPGVTAEYFGNSGELYPAISVLPAATGFAYDHEVTPIQVASPGITTEYFGNSGELFPETAVVAEATTAPEIDPADIKFLQDS